MEKLTIYLAVALGSALGGVGRFWLSGFAAQRVGETFPWGTLLVNGTGSLAIGLYVVASVAFCLLAVWLGHLLGQALNR